MTPCDIFINNYINEIGYSETIFIDDLIKSFGEIFKSNNGCQWARKGSKLDKNYNLIRIHANEIGLKGNRVIAIRTEGFRKTIENHSIPKEVKKYLKEKPCAVLGILTTDIEIDHKNGKYNTNKYNKEDFQPLTKAANDAKREHCKKCNTTRQRFKASTLGYSIDYFKGNEKSETCEGCYWNDPQKFNQIISANFKN